MAGVTIATDQCPINIPQCIRVSELVKINKARTHQLSNTEQRVIQVKKNKIYNPTTLKKQMNLYNFDDLTRKINKAKLMRFITAEPERFHLYLVTEFYRKAVVASDNKSFKTKVFSTRFISPLSSWRRSLG